MMSRLGGMDVASADGDGDATDPAGCGAATGRVSPEVCARPDAAEN
jgi:hypothetical protein